MPEKRKDVVDLLVEIRDVLKGVAPAEVGVTVPEIEVPSLEQVVDKLDDILEVLKPRRDYVVIDGSVSSGASKTYLVKDDLLRMAYHGYITSDDGEIKVKINQGQDIPLNAGDTLPLDDFETERVDISTTSGASLRFRGVAY